MGRPILILVFLFSLRLQAQVAPGIYRIEFSDKARNNYSLQNPSSFLSGRALERRTRLNISVDSTDLPVCSQYLDSLRHIGFRIINSSRWMNSCLAGSSDSSLVDKLQGISFIKRTTKSAHIPSWQPFIDKMEFPGVWNGPYSDSLSYGYTWQQTHFHHGESLHSQGFTGNGMQIAVIDGGFYRADSLSSLQPMFDENRMLAVRDFVDDDGEVYSDHPHGTQVLSIIAGKDPGVFVGTAPDASFYLLRSEQTASEYIAEEDNWLAAAEFADSAGADIITSSLGYTRFEYPWQNHSYADMNGSSRVSRGAEMAFSRGMMVIISAGNEGNSDWRYISAPSDAPDAIAVGAADFYGNVAAFSSRGPSSDGRVKPDLISVGSGTYLQLAGGSYGRGSGTSYASPIISGLTACLWQANPTLTNRQIRRAILESCSHYSTPDSISGYGIPDFAKANDIARLYIPWNTFNADSLYYGPNPFSDFLNIRVYDHSSREAVVSLYSLTGTLLSQTTTISSSAPSKALTLTGLQNLPPGVYLLRITTGNRIRSAKVIRQ